MKKHKFNPLEKFVLWKKYNMQCYWCGEPNDFKHTTVDHIIPESLIEKPIEFKKIKDSYGLSEDYKINDFCNWVPSHSSCNAKKFTTIYNVSPMFIGILQMSYSNAPELKKSYDFLLEKQSTDKSFSKIITKLHNGNLKDGDIVDLLKITTNKYDWAFPVIDKSKLLYVPEGWVVTSDNGDKLDITNGKISGFVPTSIDNESYWRCTTCNEFGPWSGLRCLNCGRFEEYID